MVSSSDTKQSKRFIIKNEDRINLFRGMLLTRATDNALKHIFLSGEITYKGIGFQGKGFRSLGQEAIYGACFFLKRQLLDERGAYCGDIASPLIRDLGVFLCLSGDDVQSALNAQAGKIGTPSEGRDLHIGDFSIGAITPAAPLAIGTTTLIGMALGFKMRNEKRVALSFIGDGGTSLGEWHESINFASVHKLPMIFCIQNNQTALSTDVSLQCRAQKFADKAPGYGIEGITIDGNDVELVAKTFKDKSEAARNGNGPFIIELETMRMCGHAHHDDMLYLGYDPEISFDQSLPKKGGYVNEKLYVEYLKKDPIVRYQKQLLQQKILSEEDVSTLKSKVLKNVKDALKEVKKRNWPSFEAQNDQELVYKKPLVFASKSRVRSERYHFDKSGRTYLQAIAEATKEILSTRKNALVLGEDVAPPYGNAFMMFRGFDSFKNQFINTPISENAIVGACVGLSYTGFRPIGEIQFNDFVACAMNQVANNAAKSFFRLNKNVPMVLRMPYGGLRRAGPYHSQDTSPWFYRTYGLKIFAPATPLDAYQMLLKAHDDPDPVLFFEHIALYRDPKIKQTITPEITKTPKNGALIARAGSELTLISYGAYVHKALHAAQKMEGSNNRSVEVIDLRYLSPVDMKTLFESVKKTSKALLVGEDSSRGSILESIAAQLGHDAFAHLDAPIRVLGARNVPVPYSPSLEDEFLINEECIMKEAESLINY